MKRISRHISLLLVLSIIFSFIPCGIAADSGKSITILFTNDLHDHFYPMKIQGEETITTIGGYARLYTAIKAEQEKDPELLLVDAGDFSMGTLFQSIFASHAPQLRIMGKMGYDVTTFGNHEFDLRPVGLANSLRAATASGDYLPQIVSSNISFPEDYYGKLTPSLQDLKDSMDLYGVKDYCILKRKGLKIGIFGIMGDDSAFEAPMSEVVFSKAVENAKRVANILKNEEKVDLVLCLSHSGTWDKKSESEDEILAEKVSEIDVIISGHTHTRLESPIIIGNTIIGSCGESGESLGILKINKSVNKGWELISYDLKAMDDSIPSERNIEKTIEDYKEIVQKEYLNNFDMVFDDVLAYCPFSFTPTSLLGKTHEEDTLGNLMGDAFIYAIKEAEKEDYEEVTAAVIPYGTIRSTFVKGDITIADTFNVSSLGIGPDKVSGYPIITVYLTGKELKTAAEVDASIAPIMNVAQLYISGISYTFNPHRLIFNKVTEVYLQKFDGTKERIVDNKLYRVAAGLYSAQMLSIVGDKSHGLLSLVPKSKDGTPIKDFEEHIVYNGNHEIKEWLAIAEYLKSFDKAKDGVPVIPSYYNETHGRKIVDNEFSVLAIMKNPNKIAFILYLIIAFVIAIIILIIVLVRIRKKNK